MLISASNSSREGISARSSSWKFLGVRKALLSLKEFRSCKLKDNTMTKRKRQTMVYKTLYGKLKIEQYELQ
jgi:hypothetical protein